MDCKRPMRRFHHCSRVRALIWRQTGKDPNAPENQPTEVRCHDCKEARRDRWIRAREAAKAAGDPNWRNTPCPHLPLA